MNRKLTIAISLLVVLAFSSLGQALAQSQEIGVHVGDRFVYSITAQYSSSNSSVAIPPGLVDANKTTTFNVTVTAVQNPNVTATIAWSFSNGTVVNSTVTVDVDSGNPVYYVPNAPVFEGFYYANLGEGDLLRPSGSYLPINQTITGSFASGFREVNFAQFTFTGSVTENITTGIQTTSYFIDKATGVLFQRVDNATSLDLVTTLFQSASETWTLVETNLWNASTSQNPTPSPSPSPSIPEFPQTMILPVVAAMFLTVTVGLAAYRRRNPHNVPHS